MSEGLTAGELAGIANPFAYLMERFGRKPLAFVRDVFGATPDPWQYEALVALQTGHLRLSIRSGHGVGKTTFLAWVIIWFILCKFPQKTAVTAPSAPPFFGCPRGRPPLMNRPTAQAWQDLLDVTSDRVTLRARPDDSFVSAR